MAFYSGLYSPPLADTPFNDEKLIIPPVPIHSLPRTDDFLNVLDLNCPKKDVLWKIIGQSKVVQKLVTANKEIIEKVVDKTNMTFAFYELLSFFDSADF